MHSEALGKIMGKGGRVSQLAARLIPMGSVTIRPCDNAIVEASETTPAAGPKNAEDAAGSTLDADANCFRTMPATLSLVRAATSLLRGQSGVGEIAGVHGYGHIVCIARATS